MNERTMVDFIEWAAPPSQSAGRGPVRSRRRRRWIAIPVALALLLTPMSIALANHIFPDVLNSNPHHTTIGRIAMAGITAGCGGTANYCPDDPVTRAQMATFLHRGLGRVAADDANVSVAPGTDVTVASLTITPGYATNKLAGANGFLKIDGALTIYETEANACECFVRLEIHVDGVDLGVLQYAFLDDNAGDQLASAAITTAIPVSANGARTVTLVANEYLGGETLSAYGSLTALYVPFGSTGTDLLGSSVSTNSLAQPGE
jgi:hypothetical protein